MNFLTAIIKPSYWLTHQHPVPEAWKLGLSIFFGLLLVVGLVTALLSLSSKFKAPIRRICSRLSVWGWTMGLVGFVLLFFSVQRISFISARIFYLFWLIAAIWWLIPILRYAFKDAPRLMAEHDARMEKEKYLPKRKK